MEGGSEPLAAPLAQRQERTGPTLTFEGCRWTGAAHCSGRSFAVRTDLRARLLECVGDRVLEAQDAAFAGRGVPGVCAVACAGGIEKRCIEPRVDGVLGFAVAVCSSSADECCRALGVAADHSYRG